MNGGAGDAGDGVDEFAVGDVVEGVEGEPFAVAPGGVEPAGEEGEVLLALANGKL